MNYPSIKEYIEAIRFAEDNFDKLKHLRPVLGEDGEPVMTSGNFAVVFQMKDEQTGKLHAVKCFLREQEGRAEAYRQITEELEYVSSTFLTPIKYLDKELFVDTNAGDEKEFPVLLMDWVEGDTLDKYIRKHLNDQYELSLLAYQFSRLAMWLMPQPFAHGDLKPDNILVKSDGTLVLVDYDGMYVPAMKGQRARELGSPDFRHPSRTEIDFDEHIDDFSLASILLSLKAISLQPSLLDSYGAQDRLLFSEKDYRNLSESEALNALRPLMQDAEQASLYSLFILALSQNNLSQVSFRLFNLSRPEKPHDSTWIPYEEQYSLKEIWDISNPGLYEQIDGDVAEVIAVELSNRNYALRISIPLKNGLSKELKLSPLSKLEEWDIVLTSTITGQKFCKDGCAPIVRYDGELYLSTEVTEEDLVDAWTDEYGIKYNKEKTKLLGIADVKREVVISNNTASVKFISKDDFIQHLKTYSVIEGTKVICDGAFERCSDLKQIIIPNSVNRIGRNAFAGCFDLVSINIPESVIEIGDYAFDMCHSLKSIFIPFSVKNIGCGAFSDNRGLSAIKVDERNPFYDSRNNCNAIINKMSNSIERGCISTIIPDKIIAIGDWAFSGCVDMESIVIPYGIKEIGEYAFSNCELLSSIEIPDSVSIIGDYAFNSCYSLKTIFLPESISKIGNMAFFECGVLTNIIIPYGKKDRFDIILSDYKDKFVEQDVITFFSTEVIKGDLENAWTDEFGVKYSLDRRRLLRAPNVIDNYSIKTGTIVICDNAFSQCHELQSVHIPNSVTTIGDFAFYNCVKLCSVIVPKSVIKMGMCVFEGCERLPNYHPFE